MSTTTPINTLRASVVELRDDMAYRLGAMLDAARLLASHQRVHAAVAAAADVSPEFDKKLGDYCPGWRDPGASSDDGDVLSELLRVACWNLDELVDRAGKLGEPWAKDAAP